MKKIASGRKQKSFGRRKMLKEFRDGYTIIIFMPQSSDALTLIFFLMRSFGIRNLAHYLCENNPIERLSCLVIITKFMLSC